MNLNFKLALLSLGATASLCAPFSLSAMSVDEAAERTEQLVVTGELRATKLLELANSVSVLTDEIIETQNARSVSELFNLAPNLNFAEGASRGRFIQIRGIGERSQFVNPINPSVGVLVDGIDFTGLSLGATTVDTAQVEIFRGPQGAQFGANALAGLINVVGKSPSDETEGGVSAGLGNFGRRDLGAHFSSPLNDRIGWRIALQKTESDGYIENTFLNREDTNNIDELSLRNHLAFELGSNLNVDLISYFIDVDNGYDAFSLDNDRTTQSDQPGHDRQRTVAHAVNSEFTGFDSFDINSNFSVANADVEYGYDEDWTFSEICPIDSDCAFFQYSTNDNYERDNKNLSADIRFSSKQPTANLSWVGGVYYREQQVDLLRTYTDNYPNNNFYGPITSPDVFLFDSEFSPTQFALYGELNYRLNTRLNTVFGLRFEDYESEYRDSDGAASEQNEDLWGGKAAIEFKANEDTLLYALVSRGYKPGGFNPSPLVPVDDRQFFTEWQVNYEAGLKGQWFDGALTGNFAFFYQTRKDVQVSVSEASSVTDFVIYLDNAAEGTNTGVEAELTWQATNQLVFIGSLGLLDTEHERFFNPSHVDSDGEAVDLSGRDQAHAPNYQYFVAGQYDLLDNLYVRLELEGKDAFFFSESHDIRSQSYRLLNARIGLDVGAASFAIWGKNLTDELVETRGFFFSNDFGNDPRKFYAPEPYTQKGAPFTAGVSASYSF